MEHKRIYLCLAHMSESGVEQQYIREAKNEKELVYVFTVVSEEDLPLPPDGKDYTELFEKD